MGLLKKAEEKAEEVLSNVNESGHSSHGGHSDRGMLG